VAREAALLCRPGRGRWSAGAEYVGMSASQSFIEVSILLHREAVEGMTAMLLALGAKGVAEESAAAQQKLVAYFPDDGQEEARLEAIRERVEELRGLGLEVGSGYTAVRLVEEAEWGESWKAHFHVQRIAPNLVIAPSWEPYQAKPGEQVVVLDPGMAFGTGGHATTRLCLRALAELVSAGDRVADIGCGSGILSIAAARLGAASVLATDSDPTVVPVARRNAIRNGVADRIEFAESDLLPVARGPFDIAVCNILAPEVIRLASDLPRLLASGGRFIGSGFVIESIEEVGAALAEAGLEVVAVPREEEWAAVVARLPEEEAAA